MPGTLPQQDARSLLSQVLVEVGGGLIHADRIRDDQALGEDLGVDSMGFVTLILELEQRLGRKVFSIDNLSSVKTVGDLARVVDAATGTGA